MSIFFSRESELSQMILSIENAFADRWKEYTVEATCDDLVILFFKAYDPYHTLPRR
jgi:hypothetical protein